jgi:PST family polysaccharide transporter
MLGFAPWVVSLLYSPQFAPTVDVLRWQILGDIFKVVTWPIGFLLLARGSGKTFVFTESIGMSVYVLGVFIGLPLIGVRATGVAFLALYVVQLPLVWWVAGRRIDFHWSPVVIRLAVLLVLMSVLIDIVSFSSEVLGAVFASLGAIAMGTAALLRLSEAAGAAWIPKRMAELGKKSKLLMVNSNSVGADRESTL